MKPVSLFVPVVVTEAAQLQHVANHRNSSTFLQCCHVPLTALPALALPEMELAHLPQSLPQYPAWQWQNPALQLPLLLQWLMQAA